MTTERAAQHSKAKHASVRLTARKAIAQLLEPLTGFVIDSGMSIQEFSSLVRQAAVHGVAAQQLEVSKRVNISGIAAATGISRADVSKILKSKQSSDTGILERYQQSTTKILAAWNQDPKFTAPNGQPADLKIYGRGATFDVLVKSHGRGIPTRAMLDELLRAGAVELRPAQAVRLKTILPIDKGLSPQVIKAFGDRVTELMTTLLQNMRHPENALFVASVSNAKLPAEKSAEFKAQLSFQGGLFLSAMKRGALNPESKVGVSTELGKVSGVTVFGYGPAAIPDRPAVVGRRNFKRR